jgi:hypothetical protein
MAQEGKVMCKLKSMIALKGRIYMSDVDSHSDMLSELKIKDDYLGASKKFVRLELSPADGDPFSDIDTWVLNVDQDIRPEWYSDDEYKPMAIDAVKEWAKTHIFVGVDNLKLNSGSNYYIKDCNDVEICGSATVKACGSATVEACDSATVEAWGSATVKACDSATVKALGSATVEAWGSAIVFNSTIFRWQNQSTLILCENAIFKDNVGKVIYQAGGFKLVSVESGKAISEARVGEKIT